MIPVRFRILSASSRLRQGFKLTHKLRLLNDGLTPLPVYGLGADLIPLARLERDRMPFEGDIGEVGYSQSTPQQVLIYTAETCIPYIAILDLSLEHPRLIFRELPDPLSGIEPEAVLRLCPPNPSRGILVILTIIIILCLLGGSNRISTCTVSQCILNPSCLPIPLYSHIDLFYIFIIA